MDINPRRRWRSRSSLIGWELPAGGEVFDSATVVGGAQRGAEQDELVDDSFWPVAALGAALLVRLGQRWLVAVLSPALRPAARVRCAAPLIRPPRLRTEEEGTAARLELFLELAYVLVLAELATTLAEDLTWHGAGIRPLRRDRAANPVPPPVSRPGCVAVR